MLFLDLLQKCCFSLKKKVSLYLFSEHWRIVVSIHHFSLSHNSCGDDLLVKEILILPGEASYFTVLDCFSHLQNLLDVLNVASESDNK